MSTQLVEIRPLELKFTFEVKKQSSCMIHIVNLSDQYVAFKVKTTSPKKYCVRPNIGIIKPKLTSDFTVIMQAQRLAPPDMQCKDKFLIQSTIVPSGTTEGDIASSVFAKDSGKYVEDYKLRVVLISPPHSPVLLPINGVSKQESSYEASTEKDKFLQGVENLPPLHTLEKDVEDVNNGVHTEEPGLAKDKEFNYAKDVEFVAAKVVEDKELIAAKETKFVAAKVVEDKGFSTAVDVELVTSKEVEPRPTADVEEETKLKLTKEVDEIKSKLNVLESKLLEAEATISKLKEDRGITIQEKETLKQELAVLKRITGVKRVQRGFPLLFVCMVALISLTLGYRLHP